MMGVDVGLGWRYDTRIGPILPWWSRDPGKNTHVTWQGPASAALSALRRTEYLASCAGPALAARLAPHSTGYMVCVAGAALVAGTACLCMERQRWYICVGLGAGVEMGVDVRLGWR